MLNKRLIHCQSTNYKSLWRTARLRGNGEDAECGRVVLEGYQIVCRCQGDLESQLDIEQSIRSGVSFKGSQLLTLIFAIFIASLGLNTNSIPVIIGAMLISPLMGPIMGMGLGIGVQDFTLLKREPEEYRGGSPGSLVTSAIYFLISPQYEGASQLLARTSPSIYDVFVAVFGGAAGILSVAAKNKGQVMPGVAIATSLMPPPLHGRLRAGHMADEFLSRSALSFLHQYDIHHGHYLGGGEADGIQERGFPG